MLRSTRFPALTLAAALAAAVLVSGALVSCAGTGDGGDREQVIQVPRDAATIAEAAERIAPGGLILLEPGTYTETVLLNTPGVTLRGLDRNQVIIDGEGIRPQGVLVIADGVRVENLTVTDHVFNGVLVTGLHIGDEAQAHGLEGYETLDPAKFPPVQGFSIRNVTATSNGLYGLYAFDAQHGLIADSYASGSADAGIYVGQCIECDIVVSGNIAEANAIGLEIANASDSVIVTGNRFSGNRVGLTLISNHREAFQPQHGNTVAGNLISGNVNPDSPAQADGGFGIGVGIGAGQDNLLRANTITGNAVGVLFSSTEDLAATGNRLDGNDLAGNTADGTELAVGDSSQDRTPAADNCLAGNTGVADGCGPFPRPALGEAPPGMPFFDVPLPGDQPGLTGDLTAVPPPLPAAPTAPVLPTTAPGTDLLAQWARLK